MYMLNTLLSVLDAALLVHAYDSAPNVPDGTNFIETKLFENVVSATRLQQSLSRAVEILLPVWFLGRNYFGTWCSNFGSSGPAGEERQFPGARILFAGTADILKLSPLQISVFLVRMATWWSGDNSGYELRERDSGVNGGLAGGQALDHPTPDWDTHSVINHPHPKLPNWPDISPQHTIPPSPPSKSCISPSAKPRVI